MTNNLRILRHPDGTWLHFKSSDGREALLQVEALAGPGIIGACLRQWCADRQAERDSRCRLCGEQIEEGIADGCRDPHCPQQDPGG